jgi:C1A family cysteine protease
LHQAGVLAQQKAIVLGALTDYRKSPLDRGYTLKTAVAHLRSLTHTPMPEADKVYGQIPESNEPVANSIDWRSSGKVQKIKDQGQCGSCWSFSTTGALEGAYAIKTGNLESFSEQQLVDCDTLSNGGRDHGCNGGLMDGAFQYAINNGMCSEETKPRTVRAERIVVES